MMHQVEVQLVIGAAPQYFLMEQEGGEFRLPCSILGYPDTSYETACKIYNNITGLTSWPWNHLSQVGFYEIGKDCQQKIVLYNVYIPERVPANGEWISVDRIKDCATPDALTLLLESIHYRGSQ